MDAAVSFYYFYGSWLFELEDLSLEDFVDWMIIRERPPDTPAANAFQMQHLGTYYSPSDRNLMLAHRSFVVSAQKR